MYPKDKPTRQDFIKLEQDIERFDEFTKSLVIQLRNRLLQIDYDEESDLNAKMPTHWWAIPWEATRPDQTYYLSDIDAIEIYFTKTYQGEPDQEYILIPFSAIEAEDIDKALKAYLDYCEKRYKKYLDSQKEIKETMAKVKEEEDRKLYEKLKERFEPTTQQETHYG